MHFASDAQRRRAARPLGRRQDADAAHDLRHRHARCRAAHRGRARAVRFGCRRVALAAGAPPRLRIPGLRPLPAPDGAPEHRLRRQQGLAQPRASANERDRRVGRRCSCESIRLARERERARRRVDSALPPARRWSTTSRTRSRAASASAPRWRALVNSRPRCCSTSPSPRSTGACASSCARAVVGLQTQLRLPCCSSRTTTGHGRTRRAGGAPRRRRVSATRQAAYGPATAFAARATAAPTTPAPAPPSTAAPAIPG